ncbi:YopX family protein [Neomoorella thermoacetica]|nr:YopX family protein [Moorella thermoacetica]
MCRIKFRAWDIQNRIMLYDVGLYPGNALGDYLIEDDDAFPAPFWLINPACGRFIIQQYTGLFDDNGRDIYEGDIVRLHDKFETKSPYISRVYWTHDGALVNGHPAHLKIGAGPRYRNLSEYCSYGICEETMCSCEVIGNIYENPELLEFNT